jgi:hypothetical protein
MVKYEVKSEKNMFEPFEHLEKEKLGWLEWDLEEKIWDKLDAKGAIPLKVRILKEVRGGMPYEVHKLISEDVRVRPEGETEWFTFEYRPHSSINFLRAPSGKEYKLHPYDKK